MKARRAVDAVAVKQGHAGQRTLGTRLREHLRERCSFEEAESGPSVEFDERHLRIYEMTDCRIKIRHFVTS
jgi:hypothetical protein